MKQQWCLMGHAMTSCQDSTGINYSYAIGANAKWAAVGPDKCHQFVLRYGDAIKYIGSVSRQEP